MAEPALDMVVISGEELRKHRTPEDCWIAVHSKVYDVTEFLEEHPGGSASKFLLFIYGAISIASRTSARDADKS